MVGDDRGLFSALLGIPVSLLSSSCLGDAWIWGFLSRVVPGHMPLVGIRLVSCYSL